MTSAQLTSGKLSETTSGFDLQECLTVLEAVSLQVSGTLEPDQEPKVFPTLYAGAPKWFNYIEWQIREFQLLKPNWDSYGAEPIDEEIIQKTSRLLLPINEESSQKPFVAPVPSGGIDIEWNKPARLLSIKVRKDEIRYLLFNRDGTPNQNGKIPDDKSIDELIALWQK